MSYIQLSDLKAEISPPVTGSAFDVVLQDSIDWAAGEVDRITGRHFEAATELHYFGADSLDPRDGQLLIVDGDLLSVGTLVNGDDDATVIGSADYWLWPRNQSPHWAIKLKANATEAWELDTDQLIQVNGTWGYIAAVDDNTPTGKLIKGVTLRLAAWRYKSRDLTDTTTIYSEAQVQARSPAYPQEVEKELESLRRLV